MNNAVYKLSIVYNITIAASGRIYQQAAMEPASCSSNAYFRQTDPFKPSSSITSEKVTIGLLLEHLTTTIQKISSARLKHLTWTMN
jgi:hypothetical protein